MKIEREDCTQNDIFINGIKVSTWYSKGVDNPYHAVNMSEIPELLHGYSPTQEELTELPSLMAGYCRLVEEFGLIGFGETELDAINDLFNLD